MDLWAAKEWRAPMATASGGEAGGGGVVRLSGWLVGVTMCWLGVGAQAQAAMGLVPDATIEIDKQTMVHDPKAAPHPMVAEVLGAFERAEHAVETQRLDDLMTFYSPDYNYHGLKLPDVRRVWEEVFTHYHDLSSTHLFSRVKLFRTGVRWNAELTCTGGLYGKERESGKRITIDSWFGEVHYLVKEADGWRFLGNAGDAPRKAPFASAPHHPLF